MAQVAVLAFEEHRRTNQIPSFCVCKMAATYLDQTSLSRQNVQRINSTRRTTDKRVKVYTIDGVQIGLAGLGEGDNRLTFPAHIDVEVLLTAPANHWIRAATAQEMREETPSGFSSTWWRALETFQPRSFVYQNGTLAYPGHPIGLWGDVVTALPQEAKLMWEEKPCCDVDHIDTPPTPV